MADRNKQEQFEKAFDDYSDELYRYCYFRLGKNKERSEEIVQDCFMKTWKASIEGEDIQNVRAFLYRIAHNLVVNEYRDAKHHASLDEMSETIGFEPGSDMKSAEEELEASMAIRLLDTLSSPYREIMVLRYVNDLPVKDIAALLNESESAVSVKIHRAIKKLRELMEK